MVGKVLRELMSIVPVFVGPGLCRVVHDDLHLNGHTPTLPELVHAGNEWEWRVDKVLKFFEVISLHGYTLDVYTEVVCFVASRIELDTPVEASNIHGLGPHHLLLVRILFGAVEVLDQPIYPAAWTRYYVGIFGVEERFLLKVLVVQGAVLPSRFNHLRLILTWCRLVFIDGGPMEAIMLLLWLIFALRVFTA